MDSIGFAPPCGDDGNEVLSASRSGKHFHHELSMIETTDDEASRGALSAQSQAGWQSEQNALSSASLKALQKELPVAFIMSQNASFIESFCGAVRKEQASWDEWKPVRQLSPEETRQVLSDKLLSRRILRSRMLYRDKNSGVPPLAPKARLVVTGFSDPDLATLRRYSPVLTRLGLYMVLQLFSSSHTSNQPWRLVTGDIATAFLQGTQERAKPVYMYGPRDPLITSTGCFGGGEGLFEIHGNVYGLANAPATFSASVVKRLHSVGFVQHPLDSMLFLKYGTVGGSKQCSLIAAAGFHVDDLILSCHPGFALESVKSLFTWGNWVCVEPRQAATITFTGRQIRVNPSGKVVICQPAFVQTVPVKHATMRGCETDQLINDEDRTAFRSATGTLQWLSSTSRPDISSWCSLLQRATPTLTDLRGLYEAIEFVRESSEQGIAINPIPLVGCVLVVYSDSSFANAEKGGSQGGMLITLCPEAVLKGEAVAGSIVEWKSFKSKRICRSTLAAEAMASEASIDHAQYAADFMSMALTGSSLREHKCCIPFVALTDCKSLFDAVLQSSPCLEEKRTILTTAAIREAVETNHSSHPQVPPRLFWVPTEQQMADALTKMSKPLRRSFLTWVMDPTIRLQMTPNGSS
eukprot:4800210-Amphidinium_carterae.1